MVAEDCKPSSDPDDRVYSAILHKPRFCRSRLSLSFDFSASESPVHQPGSKKTRTAPIRSGHSASRDLRVDLRFFGGGCVRVSSAQTTSDNAAGFEGR